MMENEIQNTEDFWAIIDDMVASHKIIIDRPKGQPHPKWPNWIYEANYGYLEGTASADSDGIDVWVGTDEIQKVNGIIVIVDKMANDSEIKILIGCTEEETANIYARHNKYEPMKGLLIRR